jgi:hypothetical protein
MMFHVTCSKGAFILIKYLNWFLLPTIIRGCMEAQNSPLSLFILCVSDYFLCRQMKLGLCRVEVN